MTEGGREGGGREIGREGREQVREEGDQSQRGEGRKVLNYRLGVPKRISIRHLDKVQHTFPQDTNVASRFVVATNLVNLQ